MGGIGALAIHSGTPTNLLNSILRNFYIKQCTNTAQSHPNITSQYCKCFRNSISGGQRYCASVANCFRQPQTAGLVLTLTGRVRFIVAREGDAVPIVRDVVGNLATIHADECSGWDDLHAGWDSSCVVRGFPASRRASIASLTP